MTKKPKLISSIRAKLVSAVAMLLVAVIMVVSSTYAWFTLSTAPEVKGIQTAIGANGSLEMALVPADGDLKKITSSAGDSLQDALVKNLTWGNMIDLSNGYGLDTIALLPAALNLLETGKLDVTNGAFLEFPKYGADGRIESLVADTLTGTYGTNSFIVDVNKGVRAVGAASSMTERQMTFRNASSAASTSMELAKTAASLSLQNNGGALASIALQHAADANATHDLTQVQALMNITNDLLGYDEGEDHVTGAIEHIENAYKNIILATLASRLGQGDNPEAPIIGDLEITTLESNLGNMSLDELLAKIPSGVALLDNLKTAATELNATKTTVQGAATKVQALLTYIGGDTRKTVSWNADATAGHAGMSGALSDLASPEKMMINGYAASSVKENMSNIINLVASQGLTITLATGAGVYADIADHCGDYETKIVIRNVSYGGMSLDNMEAKMTTATIRVIEGVAGYGQYYRGLLGLIIKAPAAPKVTADSAEPLTEIYGYILDLAFRTNASASNLLLQTDAANRIYQGNTNEEIMGGGSTMTFATSDSALFSVDQVGSLMESIRLVFFNPVDGTIYGYAKLDMGAVNKDADGNYLETTAGSAEIEAEIYMYKIAPIVKDIDATGIVGGYVVSKNDSTKQLYKIADGKYYPVTTQAAEGVEEVLAGETTKDVVMNDARVATTTTGGEETRLDGAAGTDTAPVITALTQNEAQAVSVLVYLDGNNVGNDDVAATLENSMTGTLNLQFASDAKLNPMDYAPLQEGGESESVSGEQQGG